MAIKYTFYDGPISEYKKKLYNTKIKTQITKFYSWQKRKERGRIPNIYLNRKKSEPWGDVSLWKTSGQWPRHPAILLFGVFPKDMKTKSTENLKGPILWHSGLSCHLRQQHLRSVPAVLPSVQLSVSVAWEGARDGPSAGYLPPRGREQRGGPGCWLPGA